eukprot:356850-Chlamydomonas_euryale.AAC.3
MIRRALPVFVQPGGAPLDMLATHASQKCLREWAARAGRTVPWAIRAPSRAVRDPGGKGRGGGGGERLCQGGGGRLHACSASLERQLAGACLASGYEDGGEGKGGIGHPVVPIGVTSPAALCPATPPHDASQEEEGGVAREACVGDVLGVGWPTTLGRGICMAMATTLLPPRKAQSGLAAAAATPEAGFSYHARHLRLSAAGGGAVHAGAARIPRLRPPATGRADPDISAPCLVAQHFRPAARQKRTGGGIAA